MKNKYQIVSTIIGCYLCAGIFALGCGDSTKPEEELINKVYMPPNIEVTGGDTFTVPIYFDNEITISAISLPLRFPANIMRCDSISFVGSRCSEFFLKPKFVSADTIQIGLIDTVGVLAGRGLLASLHFWVHGNAPDTTVEINLFTNPVLPFGFSDDQLSDELIIPLFEAGKVHINTQISE